jgi:hypothetical protein
VWLFWNHDDQDFEHRLSAVCLRLGHGSLREPRPMPINSTPATSPLKSSGPTQHPRQTPAKPRPNATQTITQHRQGWTRDTL